jgi:hypothetical protein
MNSLENIPINNDTNIIDLSSKNNIIDNLQKSNFSLSKNVITLTNDLIHLNDNYNKLYDKYNITNNEKNKLLRDKHTILVENNIYKSKINILESDVDHKKYDIYSKDLLIKSLKDSFEINSHSKNLLIQKYIEQSKKQENLMYELKKKIELSNKNLSEQVSKTICAICYKNKINILLEPCCHMCLCEQCLSELSNYSRYCPICRQAFDNSKKIYF